MRAATTSGGSIARISPFLTSGERSGFASARSNSPGGRRPIARSRMRPDWSSSSPRDAAAAQGRSGSAGSQCANFRRCPRSGRCLPFVPRPLDLAPTRRSRSTVNWRPHGAVIREEGRRKVSRSISGSGANSAASSCIGWTRNSRRATRCRCPMTVRNGGRCAASARAAAATMRWRCRKPRAVTCGCRCKTALPGPTALPKSKSRTRSSANRPTRSSKWSRATRRAAIFPAAFPASRLTGRWSASMAAATTLCCRPTARSRPGRAVSRSSRSSSPAAS